MLLSPEFILVKEITSNVDSSNFNDFDIQELAELILEAEGVIRPITVKPTGIDSYEVIDGHLEYWAAVKAKQINPRDGERIGAFVVEGKKAKSIEKQVKLLNKIRPQETTQKVDMGPVTAEPEKTNLNTAKKEDILITMNNQSEMSNNPQSLSSVWKKVTKTLSYGLYNKDISGYSNGTYFIHKERTHWVVLYHTKEGGLMGVGKPLPRSWSTSYFPTLVDAKEAVSRLYESGLNDIPDNPDDNFREEFTRVLLGKS